MTEFDENTGSEYAIEDDVDFSHEFEIEDDIYQEPYSQDNEGGGTVPEEPEKEPSDNETDDNEETNKDEGEEEESDEDEESEDEDESGDEEGEETSEDEGVEGEDYKLVDIPEYLPDELKLREFDTLEEEHEFYKESYGKLIDYYTSQEFNKQFIDKFEEVLIQREQYVEDLKALRSALTGENAETMMKIYFPQILADYGKAPQINDQEMSTIVHSQLAKKFGEDYMDRFKKDDLLKPDSISSQILAFEQDVIRQVKEHNETEWKSQQEALKAPQVPSMSDPEIADMLEKQYKEYFAESGITETEYGEFVKGLSSYQITMKDLHRAVHFDDYINEAFRMGIEKGKKGLAAEITKANGTPLNSTPQQDKRKDRNTDAEDAYFSDDRLIANGGLSYY